jgi:hypothetical protein
MIEHIRVLCLFLIRMILYLIPDTNETGIFFMSFDIKFNIRLLLSVAAYTMCWSIAFADSTDTNTAVKVNSSSYQDWADRTDISAKFQTNHKPIYSIETL